MACNLVTFSNREITRKSHLLFLRKIRKEGITSGLLWDYLAFRCCYFLKYFVVINVNVFVFNLIIRSRLDIEKLSFFF